MDISLKPLTEPDSHTRHFLTESYLVRDSKSFKKWESMAQRGLEPFMRSHPQTFIRRLRRGVPNDFRWEVWKLVLRWRLSSSFSHFYTNPKNNNNNSNPSASGIPFLPPLSKISMREYLELAETESSFNGLIKIDIPRTFPDIPCFTVGAQQQLERILNAYANYKPIVGYCQGMNFVVGFILLVSNFKELETFQFLTVFMESYQVEGLFRENFPLLGQYIQVFDTIMTTMIPTLRTHFLDEGIMPPVYLHQWFLTLFVQGLPLCTVVVIWDFLLAGGLPSLVILTISLLKVLERFLLCLSFEDAIKFLKSLKISGDCDESRIGRMLVKQADTLAIPKHLLECIYNINLETLVSEDLLFDTHLSLSGHKNHLVTCSPTKNGNHFNVSKAVDDELVSEENTTKLRHDPHLKTLKSKDVQKETFNRHLINQQYVIGDTHWYEKTTTERNLASSSSAQTLSQWRHYFNSDSIDSSLTTQPPWIPLYKAPFWRQAQYRALPKLKTFGTESIDNSKNSQYE